jgi:multiple sugar transport system substrate-binding protein
MRVSPKKIFIVIFIISIICTGLFFLFFFYHNDKKKIELGIFSGNYWNDIDLQSYKIINDTINRYEKQNSNIKIKYDYGILKKDYSEWLAKKIIKGEEPDIFFILSKDFNTFASLGILETLDNFIKNDPFFDITRIQSKAIDAGLFDGKLYALPREVDPVFMFVNTTLLKKEGIPIPEQDWGWNVFYNICKNITKDTNGDGIIDQFGSVDFTWQDAVNTNGQKLFDTKGSYSKFDSPGVYEAIKFIKILNSTSNYPSLNKENFLNGNIAFKEYPFSSYKIFMNNLSNIKFIWECIKLPRGPRGKNASELYSLYIGISARSYHKKEAWDFLKFIVYNKDSQKEVFKYSYGIPILKELSDTNQLKKELALYSDKGKINIDTNIINQVIEQSVIAPKFDKYDEIMNIADQNIYQIIKSDKPEEISLKNLKKDIDKLLLERK